MKLSPARFLLYGLYALLLILAITLGSVLVVINGDMMPMLTFFPYREGFLVALGVLGGWCLLASVLGFIRSDLAQAGLSAVTGSLLITAGSLVWAFPFPGPPIVPAIGMAVFAVFPAVASVLRSTPKTGIAAQLNGLLAFAMGTIVTALPHFIWTDFPNT